MTSFGFLNLFGLICLIFPCQGVIYPPSSGNSLTFPPGSTGKIEWSFDDNISDVFSRSWTFTSTDGSVNRKVIATVSDDDNPKIRVSFPVIAVEKPATLILKNVDRRYDGKYKFQVTASTATSSVVTVFIAAKPNVSINCSTPITVKEGDTVTCNCKCKDGIPSANCTWYKNSTRIGGIGKEMKTLNLYNVTKEDNGIYTCVGKSHVKAQDENSIKVTVYYKPVGTTIKFSSFPAVINQFLTVTCLSYGLPDPNIIILHNDTKVESCMMTYNIFQVNWTHAGTYKCVAKNHLGNDSFSIFLRVNENKQEDRNSETEWYFVLGTVIFGIIIGIMISYLAFVFRRGYRESKLSNRGPQTPPP